MNLRCVSVWLVALGATMGFAEPPRGFDDPRLYPNLVDPNDPEKTRATTSPEKRERLGLSPHTWTEVVHPNVYPTLERLNETVARLKRRLDERKGRDVEASDALRRIQFPGMVYVQVEVRDKEAQRRVLASLKASEFCPRHLFAGAPGFLGYATKDALGKLAESPDVVGVCLDDQPLPRQVTNIKLPAPKAGDTSSQQPGVAEGKVDPAVHRALALTDRVDVGISLRADSLPALTDLPSDLHARDELREQAEKELQDRVLSTVSADDFWLCQSFGSGMSGFITELGLQKLWKHPDVLRVGFYEAERILEDICDQDKRP